MEVLTDGSGSKNGKWLTISLRAVGIVIALYAGLISEFEERFRESIVLGNIANLSAALSGIPNERIFTDPYLIRYLVYILLHVGPVFALLLIGKIDKRYCLPLIIIVVSFLSAGDTTRIILGEMSTLKQYPAPSVPIYFPMVGWELFCLLSTLYSVIVILIFMVRRTVAVFRRNQKLRQLV